MSNQRKRGFSKIVTCLNKKMNVIIDILSKNMIILFKKQLKITGMRILNYKINFPTKKKDFLKEIKFFQNNKFFNQIIKLIIQF